MRLIVAILSLVCTFEAAAKCVFETYDVTGRVTNREGRSVVGTSIAANWQDSGGSQTKTVKASADGTYQLQFQSNTYSGGNVLGDSCSGQLSSIVITVVAPEYVSLQRAVELKGKSAVADITIERAPTK